MMKDEPDKAQVMLESIIDKAKEINKDLCARIMLSLGIMLYHIDLNRSRTLLENVSKQDFNILAKEEAQKILKNGLNN